MPTKTAKTRTKTKGASAEERTATKAAEAKAEEPSVSDDQQTKRKGDIPSPFDPPGKVKSLPPDRFARPGTLAIEKISTGIAGMSPSEGREEHSHPKTGAVAGEFDIDRRVLARIAGLAAWEIDGFAPPRRGGFSWLLDTITGRTEGIRVDIGTTEAAVDMLVGVKYGAYIPDLTRKLKEVVAERIWQMTGLRVVEVNVRIQDVIPVPRIQTRA
jgi:uncharacterized alkaline shock family protein YloU